MSGNLTDSNPESKLYFCWAVEIQAGENCLGLGGVRRRKGKFTEEVRGELRVHNFWIELPYRSMAPAENSLFIRAGFAQLELLAVFVDADQVLWISRLRATARASW